MKRIVTCVNFKHKVGTLKNMIDWHHNYGNIRFFTYSNLIINHIINKRYE